MIGDRCSSFVMPVVNYFEKSSTCLKLASNFSQPVKCCANALFIYVFQLSNLLGEKVTFLRI